MTERLHFHISLSCIGEGNGNPLRCCCLENPRDGGAWWAAVYGVAQSRTRLKRLSSSSTSLSLCLSICEMGIIMLLLLSCFSRVRLCATPWTAAHQAPPSMGFSRQEYWNGLSLPSPEMGIIEGAYFTISSALLTTSMHPNKYSPL